MNNCSLPMANRLPRYRMDVLEINGAKVSGIALAEILNMVTNPDPTRWFRFERKDEMIIVHTKQEGESQ